MRIATDTPPGTSARAERRPWGDDDDATDDEAARSVRPTSGPRCPHAAPVAASPALFKPATRHTATARSPSPPPTSPWGTHLEDEHMALAVREQALGGLERARALGDERASDAPAQRGVDARERALLGEREELAPPAHTAHTVTSLAHSHKRPSHGAQA